tara:strand:- start:412 stop:669 length:258 start_codon:yes stop_codon:yes gene_type:complete
MPSTTSIYTLIDSITEPPSNSSISTPNEHVSDPPITPPRLNKRARYFALLRLNADKSPGVNNIYNLVRKQIKSEDNNRLKQRKIH